MDAKKFQLEKKTGFCAYSDVVIFDKNGKPFYATKEGTKFNLPSGIFSINGNAGKLSVPLNFEMPFYPFERDDRDYDSYKIIWCNNPHKASVSFKNRVATIYKDYSMKNLPLPCDLYLTGHELAHAHYILQKGEHPEELEKRCDEYCEHRLIDLGLNPSQLLVANKMLLKSGWRKAECDHRMHANFSKI